MEKIKEAMKEAEKNISKENINDTLAVLDAQGRVYATGKRKNSIARVWIKAGKGSVTINYKPIDVYLGRAALKMVLRQPLVATKSNETIDVFATVTGGGLSGQAGAIRHGISKALALYNPNQHRTLRKGGYLTRDSRVVERKKYGKKKARRSFQFSKR